MKTTRLVALLAVVLFLVGSGTALAANHGTYLPDPLDLTNVTGETYGGNTVEFVKDVTCDDFGKIGEIKFTYDTYTGTWTTPDPDASVGGAGIAGGFYLTGDCELADGYQWGWVQTVKATVAGASATVWGAGNGEEYPDTGGDKTDPDYPYEYLPGLNPAPAAPTIGFQDFPFRTLDSDQYWIAELGLVSKNTTTHQATVVGTFLWGFDVEDNPAGVSARAPSDWGAPTQSYLDTLNNAFDGTNGTDDWTFAAGCYCVPEPATVSLLAFSGIVMFVIRRRRR